VLCIKPFRRPSFEHGCGQCLPCRINRRRTWAARIHLEALAHRESCFITLTYSEEALPEGNTLSDEHWREFTKGLGYRYFGCGEYGEQFGRPHYHLVVFGLGVLAGQVLASQRWPYGFVSVTPYCAEHGNYVASYTVKKLEKTGGLQPGQRPEFARMSRRPAIGTPGLAPFSSWLTSRAGAIHLASSLDVPSQLRINGKMHSIGRTLKLKLRESCDIPADLPARTERQRAQYRAESSNPELVRIKESRRLTNYVRQKAIFGRRRGTL